MTSMTDLKLAALRQALDELGNGDSVLIQGRAEQIYLWLVKDDSPEMTLEEAMAEMRKAPLIPLDDEKLQCRIPISADIAAAINGDEAARERLSARGIMVFSATMSIAEPEPAAEAPMDSPKVFDHPVDNGSIRGRCSFPPATEMTDEEQAAAKKMWEDSKPANREVKGLDESRQPKFGDILVNKEGARAVVFDVTHGGVVSYIVDGENGHPKIMDASQRIGFDKTWNYEQAPEPAAEQPFDPIGKEVWVKVGAHHSNATIEEYQPAGPCQDSCYRIRRGTRYSKIYGEEEGKTWAWTREGLEPKAAEPAKRQPKRQPKIGDTVIWGGREHIIYTLCSGSPRFYAVRVGSNSASYLFDFATEGTEGGWKYKE